MEISKADDDFDLKNLDTISHSSDTSLENIVPSIRIIVSPPSNSSPTSNRTTCSYLEPSTSEQCEPKLQFETVPVRPPRSNPVVLYVKNDDTETRFPPDNFTFNHRNHRNNQTEADGEDPKAVPFRKLLWLMKHRLQIRYYLYLTCSMLYTEVENCLLFDLFWFILHLAMISMSLLYLNDCYAERHIPVYLLEAGLFGVIMNIIHIWMFISKNLLKRKPRILYIAAARSMHAVLAFIFLAGFILVYKIYPPETENRNDIRFCHYHLYYFAFAIVNITLVVVLTFITVLLSSIFYFYY